VQSSPLLQSHNLLAGPLHLPALAWPVHASHMQEGGWALHLYNEDNHHIILATLLGLGYPTWGEVRVLIATSPRSHESESRTLCKVMASYSQGQEICFVQCLIK
jgi:hypothetical protein